MFLLLEANARDEANVFEWKLSQTLEVFIGQQCSEKLTLVEW